MYICGKRLLNFSLVYFNVMMTMDSSRGSGLVALLVVIALLAFIFFGVQMGFRKGNVGGNESVIDIGISGMERAADVRDTVNERERAIEEALE